MFVLINSYSLDNILLGNQSEIPKTKKTPVSSGRATFKSFDLQIPQSVDLSQVSS